MDDCTCYIGLCHACAYDGLYDAGIYAGYADNRNSKELVYCEKKESHLRNLGGGGEEDYFTGMLHSFWQQNKWIGKSESDVMGNLPAFNADYILTYLSSVYGTIAAILLCCVLAVLIFAVFNTAMRQKNQLGMMMGCGCGIVFLINFSINILENLGVLPQSVTFLPFLSAGGSCIIVSYGLMGIVLSTYRYKNIYPRHLNNCVLRSRYFQ